MVKLAQFERTLSCATDPTPRWTIPAFAGRAHFSRLSGFYVQLLLQMVARNPHRLKSEILDFVAAPRPNRFPYRAACFSVAIEVAIRRSALDRSRLSLLNCFQRTGVLVTLAPT